MPGPIAADRSEDLASIGDRLAALRSGGRQSRVFILQKPSGIALRQSEFGPLIDIGPVARSRRGERAPTSAAHRGLEAGARWLNGEAIGKLGGNGLCINSEYPVARIERIAFPSVACAGFDCLSNKGALLAIVATPGGPLETVAPHLNSRHASAYPIRVQLKLTAVRSACRVTSLVGLANLR